MTYDEMRELVYAGFTVLHEEALEPAFRRNIPVNIRNTNNPPPADHDRGRAPELRRHSHRNAGKKGLIF